MIRYEIFSNVASTEVGLRDYPVLKDLEDSLALNGVEARFVKQVVREEAQINVASSQYAKGITVRETAVKTLHPETTLKGCVNWARTVAGRPGRGLHLHMEKFRATNGAGLVLAQLAAHGQKAFVTGMENGTWERMAAQPDLTLAKAPAEIANSKELLQEYLARGSRTTSFAGVLQNLQGLDFLPAPFLKFAAAAVKTRDPAAAKKLSPAQIVNVGLISDALERYQSLLEQFHSLAETGQIGSDLPVFFHLLTQGIGFVELRKVLLPYTLEVKREGITNKRILINEVRIRLTKASSGQNASFKKAFASLVLKARLLADPGLYRQAVRLHTADPEETEVLTANRGRFLEIRSEVAAHLAGKGDPTAPATAPQRLLIFEYLVNLAYQGEFTARHREGVVPKKAALARQILTCCRNPKIDLGQLARVNPKLPARGVARTLADRTPLTLGDLREMVGNLLQAMYPYAKVADGVAAQMRTHFRDQETQRTIGNLAAYREGAYPLLRLTNYLLGRAGQTPPIRAALLAAGQGLGVSVLGSRDQVKNPEALQKLQADPDLKVEGYVRLLMKEGTRLFPLGCDAGSLGASYRFLFTEQVVKLVRRFIGKKITFLLDRHGSGLFEAIHRHLTWEHGLILSRYQLGMILFRNKVVDRVRLKEFGFAAGAMENGHQGDNPWLHQKEEEAEKAASSPFDPAEIERTFKTAIGEADALVRRFRELGGDAGGAAPALPAVIAALWDAGDADPRGETFRTALANTEASQLLWKQIQAVTSKHFQTIVPPDKEEFAVEIELPGRLAYLSWLKDHHPFKVEGQEVLFRLAAAPEKTPETLDPASCLVAQALTERLGAAPAGRPDPLAQAVEILSVFEQAWDKAVQISMIVLTGQMLRETIETLAVPAPPQPADVRALPQEKVMCLGMSSSDQPRFHRLIDRADREGSFATLSQLASWLITFSRLREEFEDYREIIGEIHAILAGLNFSVFDAPYLKRYGEKLKELDQLLSIRPEDLTLATLADIERTAMVIGRMVREIFDRERSLGLRDRWLGRVTMRLRVLRPNTELTFVHRLFERPAEPAPQENEEPPGAAQSAGQKGKDYQTFSERVRQVIENRQRLLQKEVFVLSPGHTQGRLAIGLLDQLFRLKGLFVIILADISNAEEFVGQLRTRLPPHRLFSLADL